MSSSNKLRFSKHCTDTKSPRIPFKRRSVTKSSNAVQTLSNRTPRNAARQSHFKRRSNTSLPQTTSNRHLIPSFHHTPSNIRRSPNTIQQHFPLSNTAKYLALLRSHVFQPSTVTPNNRDLLPNSKICINTSTFQRPSNHAHKFSSSS